MNFGRQRFLKRAFFGAKNGLVRFENTCYWDKIY
jgi:hypothetical protein